MHSKLLPVLTFVALVSAQCNTGSLQCCSSTQAAGQTNGPLPLLLNLLGVVVGDLSGLIGVTCSPIDILGVSGTACAEQPVCCTGNNFNGIIATGCTPVNLNL